jgi:hypothetical protein
MHTRFQSENLAKGRHHLEEKGVRIQQLILMNTTETLGSVKGRDSIYWNDF